MPEGSLLPVPARAASAARLLPLLVCLTACGGGDREYEVSEARVASTPSSPAAPGTSTRDRFFAPPPQRARSNALVWDVPAGWEELPAKPMREVTFRVAGDERTECYLALLPGRAGGAADNVNRWRDQMGLAPLTPAEVEVLPSRRVLGVNALLVDLRGDFGGGMGAQAIEDAAMLGAILPTPSGSLFVKMVGPASVVEAETASFDSFLGSLSLTGTGAERGVEEEREPAADPHAGVPGAPPVGGVHGADAPGAHGAAAASTLPHEAPEGWVLDPGRAMRAVSYKLGESGETECYVAILGGAAGGEEANVNRWLQQLGGEALSSEEFAALERVTVLGRPSVLVQGRGSFRGMGGESVDDATLLGVVCTLEGETWFVKMVGPTDEVVAARDEFVAFCKSLEKPH
jgi:hypothetical protein